MEGYDYASEGAYFVTMCTRDRECLFGRMENGKMICNRYGQIALACWQDIPGHFNHVLLDEYVVMPNHVHGIIWINGPRRGDACVAPAYLPNGPAKKSLGAIIGSFKSAVTRRINRSWKMAGESIWQRNYYEHIIRNDDELNRITQYIADNPMNWAMDPEYVHVTY